jgi:adenylate cyclase
MTEIVFRHQGTVDKFMGDCMMAFWGPPQSVTGHATRALEAAEEILSWLEIGNAGWQQRFGVSLELAIGVNTGEAILGNVGSESRMEYTVIGDAVNIAARLEAIARPQQILVTEATVNAADDIFDVVDVGQKQLAGHEQPVLIYEVRL